MSKIANLTTAIARKSRELQLAKDEQDWDEVERLEDELYNLEDELEDEEERSRDQYDSFI